MKAPGELWTVGFFLVTATMLPAAEMPAPVKIVLETYCLRCHDDATNKAKLSVETLLAKPFGESEQSGWIRIHDRTEAAEMPPKDKPQPSAEERRLLVDWLRKELHAQSLASQQREGRVTLRRMNVREYENTLQDLLGISIELKSLLPEDSTVAGFDHVSTGLEVSAAHLVRYQQATDKAIAAALARTPRSGTDRTTARQRWDSLFPKNRDDIRKSSEIHLHYSARLDGDWMVFHQQSESNNFLEMEYGTPTVPGRYKLRAHVKAVNSDGKPIPVLIFRVGIPREFNVNNARVVAVRDALPDQATVIEEEIEVTDDPHLGAGKRIALKGWSLPGQKHPDELRKDLAASKPVNFSGPGLAVEWVELIGPINGGTGYKKLFGDLPRGEKGEPKSANPKADADRLIRAFLPLAFRRPVDEATAAPFVRFAIDRLDRGDSFIQAMTAAYRNVLCSPRFFMLIEKPGPLDDYALAARLSYFLWSSGPDEQLMAIASKGQLRKPDVLRTEVERMLADPKSARFTESFTGQWLDLRKLHMTKPDERYVEFDDALLWSMPRETTAFFREMLKNNSSVTEFIASDWTFLDARLARHYGVPGVNSWEMRKTPLPAAAHRGGVLTQAAILKVTANGTSTSPVLRGKWVLEKIIGKPPAPPPPDIPALEPDIRGAVTIRQQLEKHRKISACASCHVKIDPPGFALETYDVIGGWRDWYRTSQDGKGGKERVPLPNHPGQQVWRGPDVEKGYTTADGRAFKDIDEYRRILLEDREQIARNVATKLLIYATGADLQFADREVIEEIVRKTAEHQHGLRSIFHAVVQSRCFLNK